MDADQIIIGKADPVGSTTVYAIVLTTFSGYKIKTRVHSTYEDRLSRDEAFEALDRRLHP